MPQQNRKIYYIHNLVILDHIMVDVTKRKNKKTIFFKCYHLRLCYGIALTLCDFLPYNDKL